MEEEGKTNDEFCNQNADGGISAQADPAGQPAAGTVKPVTGLVQYVRRCRCGALCRLGGAGGGWLHQHLCHAVYRLFDRVEQRHQCAGGALLRRQAPQGCGQNRAFRADRQPCCGCVAAAGGAVRLPCHAAPAEHQAGPDGRRGAVPAHLLFGYAGVGAVQLRQCCVQCHRGNQKAADVSEHCGRFEHCAEPAVCHCVSAERGGRGAGEYNCAVCFRCADFACADQGAGLLRAGFCQNRAGCIHHPPHSAAGCAGGAAKRRVCHRKPVYSGGRQFL